MTDQSIRETISSLEAAGEEDACFIFAATFNLYQESLRRICGRVLVGPHDIKHVLQIVQVLLSDRLTDPSIAKPNGRPNRLTKEEEAALLQAVEEGAKH